MDTAKSITSADVSASNTLTLLIKVPATLTFYRGHRQTLCCLPGIISLIIMSVGISFNINYFYVGGRALPRPRLKLNLEPAEHSARHALLHMARPSGLAAGLRGQSVLTHLLHTIILISYL